ncbi:MAG: ABC transporter permease [Pseudomonadota bacterium]
MDFAYLADSFWRLLAGVPLTLQLAGLSIAIGLVIAVIFAIAMVARLWPINWFAEAFVFVFRGTPLLVQLFLIYYGLGQFRPALTEMGLWGIFRSPYYCALLALSLNTAAYSTEIVRGGLLSVPRTAIEAARAHGMSGFTLYRRIIGPIALRQALPAYGNEIILMVKATALASTVTLLEITGIAHKLISETFRAIEVFLCAGALYLIINFTLTILVTRLERWIAPELERVEVEATVH